MFDKTKDDNFKNKIFCFNVYEPIAKLEKFLQRKKEGLRQRLKDFLSSIKN
jgi:hypothetical protein